MTTRVKIGDVEVEGDYPLKDLKAAALDILKRARAITGLEHGVALGFTNTEVSFQEGRPKDTDLGLPSPPVYVP